MWLAIRMIIYIAAVPVAAWLGGTFDPETGNLTVNLDDLMTMGAGLATAAATFATSRFAKVR